MLTKSPNNEKFATEKRQLEFMDLGVDCLHDICDLLGIEALVVLAETCQQMQAIARASFAARKVTKIAFGTQNSDDLREYPAKDVHTFMSILAHFGDYIQTVKICFDRLADHTEIFIRVVRHCAGTLHVLHLDGARLQCDLRIESDELFANLIDLSISRGDFLLAQLPFADCQQLTTLKLDFVSDAIINRCLAATFPRLRCFELADVDVCQAAYDDFICRHLELRQVRTAVPDCKVLAHLESLERLTIKRIESLTRLTNKLISRTKMRLKSLTIEHCDMLYELDNFLVNSMACSKLRELHLTYENGDSSDTMAVYAFLHRPSFRHLTSLRELHLCVYDQSIKRLRMLGKGIAYMITELPSIQKIDVACELDHRFGRPIFLQIDRFCDNHGIALSIHGEYRFSADEKVDRVLQKFDNYIRMGLNDEHRIYVYAHFGRRD